MSPRTLICRPEDLWIIGPFHQKENHDFDFYSVTPNYFQYNCVSLLFYVLAAIETKHQSSGLQVISLLSINQIKSEI